MAGPPEESALGEGAGIPAHETVPILLPGLFPDFREGQSLTVPCPASLSLWAVTLFKKRVMGLGEPETLGCPSAMAGRSRERLEHGPKDSS